MRSRVWSRDKALKHVRLTAAATVLCWLASCAGDVSDPGKPPGNTPGNAGGGATPAGAISEQPASLRRLTRTELENSIRHVLRDDSLLLEPLLPPDPSTDHDFGFPRVLTQQTPIGAADVEQLDTLVNDLASDALESVPNDLLTCSPTAADDACSVDYVTGVLRRAFRRPATDDEVKDYIALAVAAAADVGNPVQGLAFTTAAALQSPMFLYLPEYGNGDVGNRRLTPYELAARLSYFLWESPPDALLSEKADSGTILEPGVIQEEVRRLLADPRARRTLQRFFATWMGYENIETLSRSSTAFPKFSIALARSMRQEMELLVDGILAGEDYSSLFTSRTASVDPLLAELYGLEVPESAGQSTSELIERWEAEEAGRGCNADNVPPSFFNICSAGTVLTHVFTAPPGSAAVYRLTLRAYGTRADAELPLARVRVDGELLTEFSIDALSDSPAEYSAITTLAAGPRTAEVTLVNDLFIDADRNRDVIVDWIQLERVDSSNDGERVVVSLPPTRAGLLTRGAILATYAKPIDTSPTTRGLFVRNRLLCEIVPNPPPGVDTELPVRDETIRTNRERVAAHLDQGSSCNSCHRLMDPLGLPLENFDGIGEYRTHEQGVELDVTGEIDGEGFDGAIEYSDLLAAEPRVYSCAAEQLTKFALGREAGLVPRASADTYGGDFAEDLSFTTLIERIALSNVFRGVTDAE